MKNKVIRLNENDVENIVKKILRESEFDWVEDTLKVETPEEFIINLIDSCEKVRAKDRFRDGYLYEKNGKRCFFQDDKNKEFWFDVDNVYEVLKSKFGLDDSRNDGESLEQEKMIKGVLERHYNLKGYRPYQDWV